MKNFKEQLQAIQMKGANIIFKLKDGGYKINSHAAGACHLVEINHKEYKSIRGVKMSRTFKVDLPAYLVDVSKHSVLPI